MNWTQEEFERYQAKRNQKPAAKAKQADGGKRMQALGRLPKGTMNKTETAFSQHLEMLKHTGEVLWYKFEAIKLILAPNTSITVDFAVRLTTGDLEMIDVKGSKAIFTDDARAKMKVAAAMFPFVFKVAYPIPQKEGGGWHIEEI